MHVEQYRAPSSVCPSGLVCLVCLVCLVGARGHAEDGWLVVPYWDPDKLWNAVRFGTVGTEWCSHCLASAV